MRLPSILKYAKLENIIASWQIAMKLYKHLY